ncbi:MAG: transposase [Proteobacteria bacterium]|nr:transposase [Pseudomonadota bacterium]
MHTLLIVFGSVSVSHYNTVRPHSSLGYQSPIPQTVMTKLIEPGFVMPTHQELQ